MTVGADLGDLSEADSEEMYEQGLNGGAGGQPEEIANLALFLASRRGVATAPGAEFTRRRRPCSRDS